MGVRKVSPKTNVRQEKLPSKVDWVLIQQSRRRNEIAVKCPDIHISDLKSLRHSINRTRIAIKIVHVNRHL